MLEPWVQHFKMELIQYFLVSFCVFISLYCGLWLARINPEEMKPGKRYFLLAKKLVSVAIIIALLYFDLQSVHVIIISLLIMVLVVGMKQYVDQIMFALFAYIMLISHHEQSAFLVLSVMMFIYGVIAGTLFAEANHKEKLFPLIKKIVLHFFWLILFFNLPLLFIYL